MSLEKAKEYARAFGFEPTSVLPVAMRENLTFSATKDGSKFALRLHRPGYSSKAEILSELQWMDYLANNGFSVPAPLVSLKGNLLEDFDGQIVSALAWMPGNTMKDTLADPDCNREAAFNTLGQTLARLHNISDKWSPPKDYARKRWDRDGLLGATPVWDRFWENPHLPQSDRSMLADLRQSTSSKLGEIETTLDFGLIHADAVVENVLYADGIPTLIDFDDSGYGFRLFDLATPLNREIRSPDYADIKAAMFEGYRLHRSLDTTHFALIALLRALTYLGWIIPRIDEEGGRQRLERFRDTVLSLK